MWSPTTRDTDLGGSFDGGDPFEIDATGNWNTQNQRAHEPLSATLAHHPSPNLKNSTARLHQSLILPSSPDPSPTSSRFRSLKETPGTQHTSTERNLAEQKHLQSPVSMRTPPPTAKSEEKKRGQAKKPEPLPSSNGQIGMTSPEQQRTPRNTSFFPTSNLDVSPQVFGNFQFSPSTMDVFGYNSAMPATAPVYPQDKLFWDQDYDAGQLGITAGGLMDLQADQSMQDGSFAWPDASAQSSSKPLTVAAGVPTPEIGSVSAAPSDEVAMGLSSMPLDVSFSDADTLKSLGVTTSSAGVDPSLLFGPLQPLGSSIQIQGNGKAPLKTDIGRDLGSKKDRNVLSRKVKADKDKPGSFRPGLKRRATDTIVEHQYSNAKESRSESFNHVYSDPVSRERRNSGGVHTASNRSSKLFGLSPINEGSLVDERTALTLTIDEYGRARTETRVLPSAKSRPGTSYSQRTVIDRSTEGSESDSSDSSSSAEFAQATSRNTSFSAGFGNHKGPSLANFSLDNLSQLKSSRKAGNAKGSRLQNSVFGSSPSVGPSLNSDYTREGSESVSFSEPSRVSPREVISDEDDLLDSAAGDAQSALRQVVQRRASRRHSNQASKLSRSGSLKTARQPKQHSSRYTSSPNPSRGLSSLQTDSLSPTTVTDPDLASPSTDRDSQISESTRCICNMQESGGHLMIQCDSCTKWLHVKCIGLNRRNLPPVYVCINCTGQTPNVRGGRVREPTRSNAGLASSPLARKSQKTRHPL